MGQKVNPHGARVGVIKGWDARWFADKKEFANYIAEDDRLRKYLKKKLYSVGISKIEIERKANSTTVYLYTAKPGALIGKGGAGIEALRKDISAFIGRPVNVNVMEIKKPECGRAAGCREYRGSIGEAHKLPPRYEAGHSARHEGRSQGH